MSLRGKAAIVGFGELPTRRVYPGRSTNSLLAEAAKIAIADAGLRKEQIDGLITRAAEVDVMQFAEYMGLRPVFCNGAVQHGATGAFAVTMSAAAIDAGLASAVLCVFGGSRDPSMARAGGGGEDGPGGVGGEWERPFGPVIAANGGYGLLKQRHMYEFGTTQEQFAKIAVDERFNSLKNPNGVWAGQMITVEDVINSRFTNDPLHLLECVMPCSGAGAVIVTSAERAKSLPNKPAYLLGAGACATTHSAIWQSPRMTTSPVSMSSRRAYEIAGYHMKDAQFAEFYD